MGLTLNDGDFSEWNGQSPTQLEPTFLRPTRSLTSRTRSVAVLTWSISSLGMLTAGTYRAGRAKAPEVLRTCGRPSWPEPS